MTIKVKGIFDSQRLLDSAKPLGLYYKNVSHTIRFNSKNVSQTIHFLQLPHFLSDLVHIYPPYFFPFRSSIA